MALKVYHKRGDVPVKIVDSNDMYFDVFTLLRDTEFTKEVLQDIDKAGYYNPEGFIGRTYADMWISRECLSTGAKTLLNIDAHPDVCFNVVECGLNALRKLFKLTDGYILWEVISLVGVADGACDIEFCGRHCSTVEQFEEAVNEVYG